MRWFSVVSSTLFRFAIVFVLEKKETSATARSVPVKKTIKRTVTYNYTVLYLDSKLSRDLVLEFYYKSSSQIPDLKWNPLRDVLPFPHPFHLGKIHTIA